MLNRYLTLLIPAVALSLCACAAPKEVPTRYLVPLPPEKPLVEWLGTYTSADDFPKTEAQKRMEQIVGKPPLESLLGPSGIAADGEGKVFIGDLYAHNIWVYDLKSSTVNKLFDGDVADFEPRHMTIDARKRIFLADSKARVVKIFSREGAYIGQFGTGQLEKPIGLALDEGRRRLYVSDAAVHQVKAFDLDSGKLLFAMGEVGDGPGKLYSPAGLAVDAAGQIFVVELFNARLSIFNPDGTFVRYFGERTDSLRGLENPRAASFDSEGNLWIIDFRRGAIRAFDVEGTLLFAMEGQSGHKMGLSNPAALYIDGNDEIYIADFIGRRFAHWRYLSKKALAAHPVSEEDKTRILEQFGGKAVK